MHNVAKSIMWRGAVSTVAGSLMSVLPRHINRDHTCYNDAKNDIRLDCLRRAADWLIGRLLPVIAQAAKALAGSPDKLLARSQADHCDGAALRRGTGKLIKQDGILLIRRIPSSPNYVANYRIKVPQYGRLAWLRQHN
jgi:hypothetical protein